MARNPQHVVEIGTGSGVSTAVICRALAAVSNASADAYDVTTYDVNPRLWFDSNRQVGSAAAELLNPGLLAHIAFRNPATALDAAREHETDSISFVFLDAEHGHPWPALDLLALLDSLQPGAIVVMHDVNLPLVHERFQVWGAKWVFDELDVVRFAAEGDLPNIGAIMIPADKHRLRSELAQVIAAHDWEASVSDDLLLELDVAGASA
jgi:predicted O-methyltransferase YrrM